MNIEMPESPEDNERFLRSVEEQFQIALEIFQGMVHRASEGEAVPQGEVSKTARAFSAAAQILINEKNRIHDERKRQTGVANAYALDLDAARSSIRRLLDRLRDAGSADGVSE
jgi:hypothetical protein